MSCRGPVGNYLLSLRLRRVSLLAKLLYTWSWANSDFSIFFAKRSWPWNPEITKNFDLWGLKFRNQKILGIKFWESLSPEFSDVRDFWYRGIRKKWTQFHGIFGYRDFWFRDLGTSPDPRFSKFYDRFFSGLSNLNLDLGVLPNFEILSI